MPITDPGVYAVPPAVYHADPLPEPSLSRSIAHTMLDRSPRHAAHDHPRLNPRWEPADETPEMAFGTAVHYLLLGGRAPVIVEANDWRTNAAKDARKVAWNHGRAALLTKDWRRAKRVAAAVRRELRGSEIIAGAEAGKPEQMMAWRRDGVWLRALVDWMPTAAGVPIFDLKTTGRSAAPEDWMRSISDAGYDLQAAFLADGYSAIFQRHPPPVLFVTIETAEPYAVSVTECGPVHMDLGASKLGRAVEMWRECLRASHWPSYPRAIVPSEAPPWAMTQWAAKDARHGYGLEWSRRVRERIGGPVA